MGWCGLGGGARHRGFRAAELRRLQVDAVGTATRRDDRRHLEPLHAVHILRAAVSARQ